jgi:hypothetical protein
MNNPANRRATAAPPVPGGPAGRGAIVLSRSAFKRSSSLDLGRTARPEGADEDPGGFAGPHNQNWHVWPVDIGPTRGGTYRATGFRRLEWLKAT